MIGEMGYIEAKHYYGLTDLIDKDVGFFARMRLGLAPDEVAAVRQVCFHMPPNGSTTFFQALSGDPDEEANLGVETINNRQNLIAVRTFELLGVMNQGPWVLDSFVVPIPGVGMDVAGDVVYIAGAVLNVVTIIHGCSVYFQRRKAKPGEREAIIMAQR